MTIAKAQAIEALERYLAGGWQTGTRNDVRDALTALRSLPGPASDLEAMDLIDQEVKADPQHSRTIYGSRMFLCSGVADSTSTHVSFYWFC